VALGIPCLSLRLWGVQRELGVPLGIPLEPAFEGCAEEAVPLGRLLRRELQAHGGSGSAAARWRSPRLGHRLQLLRNRCSKWPLHSDSAVCTVTAQCLSDITEKKANCILHNESTKGDSCQRQQPYNLLALQYSTAVWDCDVDTVAAGQPMPPLLTMFPDSRARAASRSLCLRKRTRDSQGQAEGGLGGCSRAGVEGGCQGLPPGGPRPTASRPFPRRKPAARSASRRRFSGAGGASPGPPHRTRGAHRTL